MKYYLMYIFARGITLYENSKICVHHYLCHRYPGYGTALYIVFFINVSDVFYLIVYTSNIKYLCLISYYLWNYDNINRASMLNPLCILLEQITVMAIFYFFSVFIHFLHLHVYPFTIYCQYGKPQVMGLAW